MIRSIRDALHWRAAGEDPLASMREAIGRLPDAARVLAHRFEVLIEQLGALVDIGDDLAQVFRDSCIMHCGMHQALLGIEGLREGGQLAGDGPDIFT